MSDIHLLIMAAGESRRMGVPKQLLPWGEQSLITHQVSVLLPLQVPITVVLGAHATQIQEVIQQCPVEIAFHPHWEKGMGTSIAFGVQTILKKHPNTSGILISLVDQPLIPQAHYQNMIQAFESSQQSIIVSKSPHGDWGAPVLFDRSYFDALLKLKGDVGAKKMVKEHTQKVAYVLCESGLEDMDTLEAYHQLLAKATINS
ncbi:MAG: nucleotidyltransferase family protein [Flavobacteriaceae bacterium]